MFFYTSYSDSFYTLFNFFHLSRKTSSSFALTSSHSYHDTSHLKQMLCQMNKFSISTNCWIRRFPHGNSACFFTKISNFFKWLATKFQQHSSDSFSIIKKKCRKWLLFTKVHFGPKCIPSSSVVRPLKFLNCRCNTTSPTTKWPSAAAYTCT